MQGRLTVTGVFTGWTLDSSTRISFTVSHSDLSSSSARYCAFCTFSSHASKFFLLVTGVACMLGAPSGQRRTGAAAGACSPQALSSGEPGRQLSPANAFAPFPCK